MLSAGAVCQNMLIAAHALGFVANWITEWCAYNPLVKERLGLKPASALRASSISAHPVAARRTRAAGPGEDRDALLKSRSAGNMGRKILFITTDQMRFDAIGANGQKIARTPAIDALAQRRHQLHALPRAERRLHAGALDHDHRPVRHHAWRVDERRAAAGGCAVRRAAAQGKEELSHRADRQGAFRADARSRAASSKKTDGRAGTFGRIAASITWSLRRTARAAPLHYPQWLMKNHPGGAATNFYPVLGPNLQQNSFGGGDTDAVQVKHNPMPRELYHTDWVADRTIAYLDSLDANEDWFVWMSFPDPHHPWDPPQSELGRVNWRDIPVPAGYPGSATKIEKILADKPHHWLDWWTGKRFTCFEAPPEWIPADAHDRSAARDRRADPRQERTDRRSGAQVMARIAQRGWNDDTDVFFTTDHGEFQGDFGLLFKGPHHVDSLMRLPLIWRPAPNAKVAPATFNEPVGQVDFAPTFCEIAGIEPAEWMEGSALPRDARAACKARSRVHRMGLAVRRRVGLAAHALSRRLDDHRLQQDVALRRHRGRALRPDGRSASVAQSVERTVGRRQ